MWPSKWWLQPQQYMQEHKQNIFQRGKAIFPDFFPSVKCFFPVENSHFGRPKTIFRFWKWKARNKTNKQKTKKKKKRSSPHFVSFSPSVFNFPPSLYWFSFFSAPFSLAPLFLVGQQKFPSQKSRRALCPLPPAPVPPPVMPLSTWWSKSTTDSSF